MAFDWREFFLFAHELRNETKESKRRTAIGRAYYYAYNIALAEISKMGFHRNHPLIKAVPGSHNKLWNWCQKQSNPDLAGLGDAGSTLHTRRIDADYNAKRPATPQVVQKQLAEVRDFELLLAQITKTLPPAAP